MSPHEIESQAMTTTPRPTPAAALRRRFFSFHTSGSFEIHETLEAARAQAEGYLSDERDDAADGWSEEVTSICYGEVLGEVEEIERKPWLDHLREQGTAEEDLPERPPFDEYVNYELVEHFASALPAAPVEHELDRLRGICTRSYMTLPITGDTARAFVDFDVEPHVMAVADEFAIRTEQRDAWQREAERLERELGEARGVADGARRERDRAIARLVYYDTTLVLTDTMITVDVRGEEPTTTRAITPTTVKALCEERDAARSALDEAEKRYGRELSLVQHAIDGERDAIKQLTGGTAPERVQSLIDAALVLQSRLTAAEREAETARAKAIEEAVTLAEKYGSASDCGGGHGYSISAADFAREYGEHGCVVCAVRSLAAPGAKEEANG